MPPQMKTFHFWLAFIMSAGQIVNASGVIPMSGPLHTGVSIGLGILMLLAYQLGYNDVAPTPPNTTGGGK